MRSPAAIASTAEQERLLVCIFLHGVEERGNDELAAEQERSDDDGRLAEGAGDVAQHRRPRPPRIGTSSTITTTAMSWKIKKATAIWAGLGLGRPA